MCVALFAVVSKQKEQKLKVKGIQKTLRRMLAWDEFSNPIVCKTQATDAWILLKCTMMERSSRTPEFFVILAAAAFHRHVGIGENAEVCICVVVAGMSSRLLEEVGMRLAEFVDFHFLYEAVHQYVIIQFK